MSATLKTGKAYNPKVLMTAMAVLSALVMALAGCSKAAPSSAKQQESMFVAAENSYVTVNVPPANKAGVGFAMSQGIFLGYHDTITVRLDTTGWQDGCRLELQYSAAGNGSGTTAAEGIVTETNPGKYQVTVTYTPKPISNGEAGSYFIIIVNSNNQNMDATLTYSRSSV